MSDESEQARLPIESQLRVLHANVTVVVVKARNLPRGAIFAPRAQVHVFCPFVEQPVASTEPSSRHTAPHWNFQKTIKLRYHASALPTLKFVVFDSGAPDTPLGTTSICIRAPATRAWLPLDVDTHASRADLLVAIRWPACPIPYIPPIPKELLPTHASVGPELRTVDPRPGAIFRRGSFVVEVTAAGIPASVAQPWLCVRSTDQRLRGGETAESRNWWKRKCELERLKSAEKSNSANDTQPRPSATPSTSCDSVTDSLDAHDMQTAAVDLEISQVNLDIPLEEGEDPADTIQHPDDSSTIYKPIAPPEHTSKRHAFRQRVTDSLHDGKLEHAGSLIKHGVKGVKSAKNKATTSLDTVQNLRPTKSAISATVTAAKIRRGKSKKRDSKTPSAALPAASPPQTTTPTSVLQTLMAPRPRRAVDFGSFMFAEFAIEAPKCLYITITDNDSRLPDALGGVLEAELPLDILGLHGTSVVLGYCEVGPVRAKASLWVRVTRVSDPKKNMFPTPVNIVTEKFMQLLDESENLAARFKQDYPDAEGMTYLFVGGLFTNHYPLYFTRNVDYLQQKLLLPRVQCIPIHTESGLAANAKVIAASVAKTATRRNSVVLIGHSKGGCDILHAITHHIEIIPFIHGVISFQAPFLGTYAIDVLKRTMLANAIGSAIETLWHGQRESLLDMSYATRKASLYMFSADKDAHESINGTNAMALRGIPIISVASHASFEIQSIRSAANAAGVASMSPIAAEITKNTGFFNDGLVVPADALIPFSDAIYLNDMMHTEPSLYVPGTKYPPGELTAAVLALLFEKAKRGEGDANK